MPAPFQPAILYDFLSSFGGGVNEGDNPLDIEPNVMAGAVNTTVRGKYVTHRSGYYKRPITYENITGQISPTKEAVEQGYFQGACIDAVDDSGNASMVALISQRLFQFAISGNIITCIEILVPGTPVTTIEPQAWLWQAERWVICNDGKNNPIIFDLNSGAATRTTWAAPSTGSAVIGTGTYHTTVPAIGAVIAAMPFANVVGLASGSVLTILGFGSFMVQAISGTHVDVVNLNATDGGYIQTGATAQWTIISTQLPPGRMGAYGLGRNWICLTDGLQFLATDIVDGASGTQAYNFRNSVLYITENQFLTGGGNFRIPASGGETIQAMRFLTTLDASLGQGPVQIFTNRRVFSCNAPVDRLTWQSITNPILTESLIHNGALSQNSTILANSDVIFRDYVGVRSLILGRQEENAWGRTPISFEVGPRLENDDKSLLNFTSAVTFDNRLLLTVGPVEDVQGVYFKGLVPLNFDPVSSLRGKEPSVWDSGVWTGLNILQLGVAVVDDVERAFCFVLNTPDTPFIKRIEIWEILPSNGLRSAIADNDGVNDIPIQWRFDSASLRFKVPRDDRRYMSLSNGEIWVDKIIGIVSFDIRYRPDQYPDWTPWRNWQVCQTVDSSVSQPGFQPRMGLGEPSPTPCDLYTNRPMRNGFTFQTRNIITGHVVFMGAFYEALVQPMPKFAPIACGALCLNQNFIPNALMGQLVPYTSGTPPNPEDINLPALAYDPNGILPTMGWNQTTHHWT